MSENQENQDFEGMEENVETKLVDQNVNQSLKDQEIDENEDELLKIMKRRIIRSYKWHEDVVVPLSHELKISVEDFENILMKKLDMSGLEALHARFESAKPICIKQRIHSDLRLCWLVDVMNIITEDEGENIKNKITEEILKNGKSYDEALEAGRKELVELLMR